MIEPFVYGYFSVLGGLAALGTFVVASVWIGLAKLYFSDRREDRTR